jgi:hypothetical protein
MYKNVFQFITLYTKALQMFLEIVGDFFTNEFFKRGDVI